MKNNKKTNYKKEYKRQDNEKQEEPRFDDQVEGRNSVLELLESGRFVCAIAVCFPDGREIVKRGTMEGLIAQEIKGNNGFGYDPIVYLPEYGKTSAELDPEEKNRISHRGKALALIKDELDKSEEMYAEDNDSK